MPEPDPAARRLSSAELKTLKLAAHVSFAAGTTWRCAASSSVRSAGLRRAVQILDEFPEGVELRHGGRE